MSEPAARRRFFPDLEALSREVTEAFVRRAQQAVSERGVCRVALAGGSTPERLYQQLVECNLPWEAMRWYWGDERNVPLDDAQSNFRMVREALLDPAAVPAETYFPVPIDVDDPAAAAAEYERMLRREFQGESECRWDLVLLGIGDDAHTASLFPETAALQPPPDRWFVENWVPKFGAHRLTLTAPAINAAREVWFLVAGENKHGALDRIWNGPADPQQYPAQGILPAEGELVWFVTEEAMPGAGSSPHARRA